MIPLRDINPTKRFAIVTFTLKNGQVFKKRVDYAKGTITNPMNTRELEDKFRGLSVKALPGEQVDKIIKMVMGLENLNNIGRLASLLVAQNGSN